MEETNLRNNSLSPKSAEQPENRLESEGTEKGSTEYKHACSKSKVPQHPSREGSNLEKLDRQKVSAKNSRRLSRYGKKIATKNQGKKYHLRSSFSSARVLRSMSKTANVTPPPLNDNPITVNHVKEKGKRRRKKVQRASDDEFSKVKKSVRYLLHRMSYEQILIDAYAGEGWKGQSSEKIKPEMELQRAKSEILRCKLKIRNLFQQLDALISEGKLDDSLFDSEGEICSEDISCAKCRSKDVSVENDIILCDGICDRGFHQKCLDPPLLKDDIPPGDEGWLCPGCDCKVDCLDLINETQGTDLSIEDQWEKVFPEAASFASKNSQHDDLELPSDDSDDHDYDPDNLDADEELKEGSSYAESDFTSASEDSGPSNHDLQDQNFGFPSDDSEDIDYDPDKPELSEKAAEGSSSSDESDFTSDTDDLNVPGNDALDFNEVSVSPISTDPTSFSHYGKGSDVGATDKSSVNSVLCSLESELGQESVTLLSGKRQREHLDYKKLYDEAYGSNLSDSSEDEEWSEMSTPKDLKYVASQEDTTGLTENEISMQRDLKYDATQGDTKRVTNNHVKTVENQRTPKRVKGKQDVQGEIMYNVRAGMNESSPKRKICGDVQIANHSAEKQNPDFEQPHSSEEASRSSKYGAVAFQKLQESFRENQYPDRETKESLARELNMTAQQVSKWFENARHKVRVTAKDVSPAGPGSVSAAGCGETSNSDINIKKSAGSKRPSKGSELKKLCESQNADVAETQNGGANTKRAVGGSTSREILVMRELRKRRMSK